MSTSPRALDPLIASPRSCTPMNEGSLRGLPLRGVSCDPAHYLSGASDVDGSSSAGRATSLQSRHRSTPRLEPLQIKSAADHLVDFELDRRLAVGVDS